MIYLLIITINSYNFILAHGFYSVKYFCTILQIFKSFNYVTFTYFFVVKCRTISFYLVFPYNHLKTADIRQLILHYFSTKKGTFTHPVPCKMFLFVI